MSANNAEHSRGIDLKQASKVWWDKIKNNPVLLNEWLIDQYRGEKGAYERMTEILNSDLQMTRKQKNVLSVIAKEELTHSKWIKELLDSRVTKEELDTLTNVFIEERYWNQTLPTFYDKTIEQLFAIGAHAEEMRLHRIKTIVHDRPVIHQDIKKVFEKILQDELIHAKIFKAMTTDKDYKEATANHINGLNALNLVP